MTSGRSRTDRARLTPSRLRVARPSRCSPIAIRRRRRSKQRSTLIRTASPSGSRRKRTTTTSSWSTGMIPMWERCSPTGSGSWAECLSPPLGRDLWCAVQVILRLSTASSCSPLTRSSKSHHAGASITPSTTPRWRTPEDELGTDLPHPVWTLCRLPVRSLATLLRLMVRGDTGRHQAPHRCCSSHCHRRA